MFYYTCENQHFIRRKKKITKAVCSVCSKVASLGWVRNMKRNAVAKSFWSNTMGVPPDQVEEERKLHPNWTFDNDGRLLVEGLQNQRKKCRELGMVGLDDVCG